MSRDVVATNFRCAMGPTEFSFGGCDRQAFQDILQFLCGLRQDSVPGAFAATWQGKFAKYELRRLDDGEIDNSAERGLFVGVGSQSFADESRRQGSGLSGGLAVGPNGSAGVESGRHASGDGDDCADNGQEFVTKGSSCGVGGQSSVRDGGSVAGVGLSAEVPIRTVTIVRGQDRGPNYERNRLNREKRKAGKAASAQASQGFGWRSSSRTVKEQELHDLKVERQIIQEKRKLDKLRSPAQMIEDAMRQIALAEKYAKSANESKVAAWAADLSNASAESIAKSAGAVDVSKVGFDSPVGVEVHDLGDDVPQELNSIVGLDTSIQFTRAEILSGISSAGSLTTDGKLYTRETAASWLRSYEYLRKFEGNSFEQMAKLGGITVKQVEKYFRLKREFNL